jgi:hypothetical protein
LGCDEFFFVEASNDIRDDASANTGCDRQGSNAPHSRGGLQHCANDQAVVVAEGVDVPSGWRGERRGCEIRSVNNNPWQAEVNGAAHVDELAACGPNCLLCRHIACDNPDGFLILEVDRGELER